MGKILCRRNKALKGCRRFTEYKIHRIRLIEFLGQFTHGDAIRDDRFEFTPDTETVASGSVMKMNKS